MGGYLVNPSAVEINAATVCLMSQKSSFTDPTGKEMRFPKAPQFQCSRLALGCMHFGGQGSDAGVPETRQIARTALETVFELGWNCFDHADIYCRGRSEAVFGSLIREMGIPRGGIFIQSKCGIRFAGDTGPSAPHRFDFSKAYIIRSAEASLKRLNVEYLDLLLLHRPDLLMDTEEVYGALDFLRTSGKVKAFGVSNHTVLQMELLHAAGIEILVNQVEINPLRPALLDCGVVAMGREPAPGHPADGTLEYHQLRGIVTQAWAPMAYGYLSGRQPDWDPQRVGAAAMVVGEIAEAHGVPAEAVVIAWLLRHPAGIQPIIGTRSAERLRACHRALNIQLSREDWYRIYTAGRGHPLP